MSIAPQLSLAPRSSIASTTGQGVLVALAQRELDQFFPAPETARLRQRFPDATWYDPSTRDAAAWVNVLEEAQPEVVVGAWHTPRLPMNLKRLKYVCYLSGSVRGMIPRELIASGLKVTNWGNTAAPMVAEHALLLILGALRAMPRWSGAMDGKRADLHMGPLNTRTLHGRRVAIHGFGLIARELIRLLEPFNVTITAYSGGVPEAFMREHGAEPATDLVELASGADVFVSCEALTEKTRASIDRTVLSALPLGSVFINVGRGAVVDETALAEVATERGLRLGLDVYAREPLPLDSPLRHVTGALLSPHIAGPTQDAFPACGAKAMDNLDRYLRGRPLLDEVTLQMFDRST